MYYRYVVASFTKKFFEKKMKRSLSMFSPVRGIPTQVVFCNLNRDSVEVQTAVTFQ